MSHKLKELKKGLADKNNIFAEIFIVIQSFFKIQGVGTDDQLLKLLKINLVPTCVQMKYLDQIESQLKKEIVVKKINHSKIDKL